MQNFDVKKVPLQGINLIEASAGTGKTYSIAILLLRIIVEGIPQKDGQKKFPAIDEILVATFTNAAVGELQERIRHFIHQAHQYIQGNTIEDELIISIIDNEKTHTPIDIIRDRIQKTLYTIDEAQITSIHGFSQRMLLEFSFETHYSPKSKLLKDVNKILQQVANDFWRNEITSLPISLLGLFDLEKFKNSNLEALKNTIAGKIYYPHIALNTSITKEDALEQLDKIEQLQKEIFESIDTKIILDRDGIEAELLKIQNNRKWFQIPITTTSIIHDFTALIKKNIKTILKLQGGIYDSIREYEALNEQKNTIVNGFQISLTTLLIEKYAPLVKQKLKDLNAFTFDALIHNLHEKVVIENNERLIQLIRDKYPVIFIDEFQDTDLLQFETFKKLFIDSDQNIVFLIGDPKQSIYAFRNADVDSYLIAKSYVDNIYTMRMNFRSSRNMIAAVNEFYTTIGLSTAFGYDIDADPHNSIQYEIIAPNKLDKEFKHSESTTIPTLHLIGERKSADVVNALVAHISNILSPNENYQIWDKQSKVYRAVVPSDIGILTFSKNDGEKVKSALDKLNIPAVQIRENTIFQSQEAIAFIYILEAMIQPNLQNIHRAIFATFLNINNQIDVQDLKYALDDTKALNLFFSYHQILEEASILVAFNKLLDDFSIRQHHQYTTVQLRILSNIEQLIQLSNQQQHRKSWNATEVLNWIKRNINQDQAEDDSYLTHIESDEDAVKIVTIHKSKGLEYNLVYVTGLENEININSKRSYIDFKLDSHKNKLFIETTNELIKDEQLNASILEQLTKERYRLIYVAITRAVYACHIFYNTHGFSKSPLAQFILKLQQQALQYIEMHEVLDIKPIYYKKEKEREPTPIIQYNHSIVSSARTLWRRMSFSSLSVHDIFEVNNIDKLNSAYEQFIFNKLPRGAKAGIALHTLLESVDYQSNYQDWDTLHFYNRKKIEDFIVQTQLDSNDRSNVLEMLQHTFNANIAFDNTQFQLKDIPSTQMLHELHFNFNIEMKSQMESFVKLLHANDIAIQYSQEQLQGLMTGFIDLFFEYNDKYYILDWKSNYLGDHFEAYNDTALAQAMKLNNYNLQYLIYSLAASKFIASRKADFNYERDFGGVVYVFLRGVQPNSSNGIYCTKPSLIFIQQVAEILTPNSIHHEANF